MYLLRLLTILAAVIVVSITAQSQPTTGKVRLPKLSDSIPLPEMISQIESAPGDSGKVRQLIALAKIYWRRGQGKNLDTCAVFLREAQALSTAIHDEAGRAETLCFLMAVYAKQNDLPAARKLIPLSTGEDRVRLLLLLAETYVNPQPVVKPFLEKAWPWITEAYRLSGTLESLHMRYECLLLMAKYYFEHGELGKGKKAVLVIIDSCQRHGDWMSAGHYWSELDIYMPLTAATFELHLFACNQSIRAFEKAGDHKDALFTLRDMAVDNYHFSHFDSAEAQLVRFLRETEKLHIPPSLTTNYWLGEIYESKGEMDKAQFYALRALENLNHNISLQGQSVYTLLAENYSKTGDLAEELRYGKMAVETAVGFKDATPQVSCIFVVDALLRGSRPQEAIDYLKEFDKANPAVTTRQKAALAYCFGRSYDLLGQLEKAAPWFRQLSGLRQEIEQETNNAIFRQYGLSAFQADLFTGEFYVDYGKFQQAKPILEKAVKEKNRYLDKDNESELHLLLFRADSAMGDLHSAIDHYLQYTAIKDSIYNIERYKQAERLQVQFETKQKEKSIELLQSEGRRQNAELARESLVRKITLAGIVLLLILAGLAYYAYRAKRRNVTRLQVQQEKINVQNATLQQLVGEKDTLLGEKDLLLQEVHHRVKNNLYVIMSLLESQSAQVENRDARAALLDSQNRVHSISLLHHKLYGSANVMTVDMVVYISELCNSLGDTFGIRKRGIEIRHSLEPVKLDVSQAMPIGMLLNEAITNALKYAFPGDVRGDVRGNAQGDIREDIRGGETPQIRISLSHLDTGEICLEVRDNGVGLPAGFASRPHSLGMTLMKGFSTQLDGKLVMEDHTGFRIRLLFLPSDYPSNGASVWPMT
jgi:two-component sensor histidine kinase